MSRLGQIHREIADALVREKPRSLQCSTCTRRQPINAADIARYLEHGWPEHCGQTMHLVDARPITRPSPLSDQDAPARDRRPR